MFVLVPSDILSLMGSPFAAKKKKKRGGRQVNICWQCQQTVTEKFPGALSILSLLSAFCISGPLLGDMSPFLSLRALSVQWS